MSNDKVPNPKEAAIPNLQYKDCAARIGTLGLGFLWSLVLGIWEFGFPLTAGKRNERPQIRLPPTAEEPGLHRRGRANARAGHRREHHRVQLDSRGVVRCGARRARDRPVGGALSASC